MKIEYTRMAEVSLDSLDLNDYHPLVAWLKRNSTFEHCDSFEFIHHLFQDCDEEWFRSHCLGGAVVPQEVKQIMLEARQNGAHRICFYV
jgi:hypothetical protein